MFAAVKLKEPINFGNVDNDPVHLVLGFCSQNSDAHIEALTRIATVLDSEDILERIMSAEDADDLMAVFNS